MRILAMVLTPAVTVMPLSAQQPGGVDEPVSMVEIVGCLTLGPGNAWLVSRAAVDREDLLR